MKKLLAVLLAAMLVLTAASAFAEGEIKLGQVNYYAHGHGFAVITVVMQGDVIAAARIEEFQNISVGGDIAAVPAVVNDGNMCAVICKTISAYGYHDVYPVYYDVVLPNKLSRDSDTAKILDMICSGIYTDPAMTFSKILDNIYYSVGSSANISSSFEKKIAKLNATLIKSISELG